MGRPGHILAGPAVTLLELYTRDSYGYTAWPILSLSVRMSKLTRKAVWRRNALIFVYKDRVELE